MEIWYFLPLEIIPNKSFYYPIYKSTVERQKNVSDNTYISIFVTFLLSLSNAHIFISLSQFLRFLAKSVTFKN